MLADAGHADARDLGIVAGDIVSDRRGVNAKILRTLDLKLCF
jgi:hypothetical protein